MQIHYSFSITARYARKGKVSEKELCEVRTCMCICWYIHVQYVQNMYFVPSIQGYFRSCPVFLKPPHADFGDIPIPPQYVRSSGGLYSIHESMVRNYMSQSTSQRQRVMNEGVETIESIFSLGQ